MAASEDVRELLAELDSGETLDNVIIHALARGREYGYQKGLTVGYLQASDEAEWRIEAIKRHGERV